MDCNQYVEYFRDSGFIPDLHCQQESSLSFIRLSDDNYAAAFHYHKQLACTTFAKRRNSKSLATVA